MVLCWHPNSLVQWPTQQVQSQLYNDADIFIDHCSAPTQNRDLYRVILVQMFYHRISCIKPINYSLCWKSELLKCFLTFPLPTTDDRVFNSQEVNNNKMRISNLKRLFPTLLIMVVRSPPLSSGFWASPTLDGSFRAFSLENVLHSEPTSMTRSPEMRSFQQLNSINLMNKRLNLYIIDF